MVVFPTGVAKICNLDSKGHLQLLPSVKNNFAFFQVEELLQCLWIVWLCSRFVFYCRLCLVLLAVLVLFLFPHLLLQLLLQVFALVFSQSLHVGKLDINLLINSLILLHPLRPFASHFRLYFHS